MASAHMEQSSDEVEDMGSFDGTKVYTFMWTITHLMEKLCIAGTDSTLDSKQFHIKGDEENKMVLSFSFASKNNRQGVQCAHPSLVVESMTCTQDVNIWWKVSNTLIGEYTRFKYELQKDTVSPTILTLSHRRPMGLSWLEAAGESCKIVLYMEVLWPSKDSANPKPKAGKVDVMKEMVQMATSGKHTDVKLVCKDRHFNCHKVVLAAQSLVFDRMFSNDNNLEVKQGIVTIKDMEPEELEVFLKYIYTGKCEDVIGQHARALLVAGDKYDIKYLVALAEEELSKSLNLENVIDILLLANRHNVDDLKKKAAKIILANFATVSKQAMWKSLKCDILGAMEESS